MSETHQDQFMNAMVQRVGKGAMKIAGAMQDIDRPGERLAALVFCMKCVVDKHTLDLPTLMTSVDRFESKAKEMFSPELSAARAYIENEVVL